MNREAIETTFLKYTDQYDGTDPKIRLKIDHTYRVAELCQIIGESIQLSKRDLDLAWLCGMLHDYGRFEQLKRYDTFEDSKSIDHASFGADLLFKENDIRFYNGGLTEEELEVLETAIRSHSLYRIDESLSERKKMFCNILRDADKIDILEANIKTKTEDIYNTTLEEVLHCEITKEVLEAFYEEHAVLRKLKKTPMDHLLAHISLTYELVYPKSLECMVKRGYLGKMLNRESLNPNTQKVLKDAREYMKQYLIRKGITDAEKYL